MNIYRVNFENNKPISSTILHDADYSDPLEVDGLIKWLPVLGLDVEDSINIAHTIIEDYI